MLRVRLTCNWCTDKDLFDRCERVYNSNHYKKDIVFTYGDDFDYLVIINDTQNTINHPYERTIGVMMEPSWATPFRDRLEQRCLYIIYHNPIVTCSQYIYYPGILPPHFDYSNGDNLDYYLDNTFKKTKKCSIITSYATHQPHKNSLYSKRVEFVKKILQTDLDIDIYGNNWEYAGIIDKRIKGSLQNKKDGLLPYEFSIALENSIEKDYFTEKITDCILTDTTPIYYGCPKMYRFFSNIYQLNSIDNVNQLTNILTASRLDQTANKHLMATKFNLYTAIDKLITKLNTN